MSKTKTCLCCKEIKDRDEFPTNRTLLSKHSKLNKICCECYFRGYKEYCCENNVIEPDINLIDKYILNEISKY